MEFLNLLIGKQPNKEPASSGRHSAFLLMKSQTMFQDLISSIGRFVVFIAISLPSPSQADTTRAVRWISQQISKSVGKAIGRERKA